MNGDGSQANPWIITTWDELISDNRQNTDYCEWHGGDINLNDIRPRGYTSGVVIKGRIDFKGATIRNYFCSLITSVTLADDCTYYETSFPPNCTVSGGILIG